MKVALITEIMSHYRLPVFNAISKQGVDLQVFYLQENIAERQWKVYKEDISHRYRVLPGYHFSTSPTRHFYFNPTMGRELSAFNPDVVICGGYNHSAALDALLWARRRNRTFILWSESTSRDRRADRKLYETYKYWFVRQCNRYVAAGTAATEYLVHFGADLTKVWIAPDAINNQWFQRPSSEKSSEEDGQVSLLYVGRLIADKGVQTLLEAIRLVRDQFSFRVMIVGDGPALTSLQAFSQKQSLACVQFVPFVQPKELPPFYWSADAFVFPSLSDPWGLVLNEAMAAGLPILSSTTPGAVDDLLFDGYNGFSFKPADAPGLAGVLSRFLALSSHVRRQLGENSARLVQYFTPERCAQGFVEASFAKPNQVRAEYLEFRKTIVPSEPSDTGDKFIRDT